MRRAPECPFGHHGQVRLQYLAVSTSTYRSPARPRPAAAASALLAAVSVASPDALGMPSITLPVLDGGRQADVPLSHVMGITSFAGPLPARPAWLIMFSPVNKSGIIGGRSLYRGINGR